MWAFFEQDTCWIKTMECLTVTDSNVSAVTAFFSWSAWATVGGSIWEDIVSFRGGRKKLPEREVYLLSSSPYSARTPSWPGSRRRPWTRNPNRIPSHLDCDGCASHEENDNWRNDENENEDRHSQPLLLIRRIQLIPHDLADSPLEWSSF